MDCRNPTCLKEAKEGSRWCDPCGERLARIRGELESDKGTFQRSMSSRCRATGCPELRARPSYFCAEHQHLEVE